MTLLVGRQAELAELHRVAAAAAAGAGGLLVVEGDAGIGKTALLEVFAEEVVGRYRARVLRGRAWEEGGAPPYWPWYEIATVGRWALDWERHDDQFGLYAEVLAAARAAAMGGTGPLVLIVDDLHAADEDTIRLTRYLARSISDAPIALVAATRPNHRLATVTRLGGNLPLATLSDADADKLIERLTPGLDLVTRKGIRASAEGNPLFLRELARSAVTGRAVPMDIVSVVTPLLGHQSPATRALVEQAAVLGRAWHPQRLATISGRSLLQVLEDLEPLRSAGVLSVRGAPPRAMFSHQLVRDVLYERVPLARRLELHAAAAATIDPDASDGSLAERAHHLLAAVPLVEPQAALTAARRAAEHARARLAFSDAATLLRRVVELTADERERFAVLLELGSDLREGGHVNEASAAFSEAVDTSRQFGDTACFAQAVLARTELVGWDIRAADLVPLITEALARLGPDRADHAPPQTADLAVRLRARRAALLAMGTNLEAALAEARAALGAARALGAGHDEALADALAAMHRCCWRPDELAESRPVAEQLVEVATRLGDRDRLSEALLATLIDALRAGDLPSADVALERYAELAARSRHPRHEFFLLSRRAMRAFLGGRLAEGERLIERAHELGQRIEEPDAMQVFHGARMVLVDQLEGPAETLATAHLVNAMAQGGETRLYVYAALHFLRSAALDQAREALAALVEAIPTLSLRSFPLFDLCLLAEVAAAVGATDVASQLWSALQPYAGFAVVNAGAVTFGGIVDEYLGGLAHALGDGEQARHLLHVAADRYHHLGARALQERANRHLRALERTPAAPPEAPRRETLVVFRRRDDGWEIGLDPHPTILRDARGLQHLHTLLRSPCRDIAATDLVGAHASYLAAREAHHALLDDRAKAAYRQRIRDLQEDLDEADAASDIERSARVRAELDLLLDELRRAVGLLGRDRNEATTAERARVTVRKAINASIERIAEHDAGLAALLRTTVKTGHQCSYTPNPLTPLAWSLE